MEKELSPLIIQEYFPFDYKNVIDIINHKYLNESGNEFRIKIESFKSQNKSSLDMNVIVEKILEKIKKNSVSMGYLDNMVEILDFNIKNTRIYRINQNHCFISFLLYNLGKSNSFLDFRCKIVISKHRRFDLPHSMMQNSFCNSITKSYREIKYVRAFKDIPWKLEIILHIPINDNLTKNYEKVKSLVIPEFEKLDFPNSYGNVDVSFVYFPENINCLSLSQSRIENSFMKNFVLFLERINIGNNVLNNYYLIAKQLLFSRYKISIEEILPESKFYIDNVLPRYNTSLTCFEISRSYKICILITLPSQNNEFLMIYMRKKDKRICTEIIKSRIYNLGFSVFSAFYSQILQPEILLFDVLIYRSELLSSKTYLERSEIIKKYESIFSAKPNTPSKILYKHNDEEFKSYLKPLKNKIYAKVIEKYNNLMINTQNSLISRNILLTSKLNLNKICKYKFDANSCTWMVINEEVDQKHCLHNEERILLIEKMVKIIGHKDHQSSGSELRLWQGVQESLTLQEFLFKNVLLFEDFNTLELMKSIKAKKYIIFLRSGKFVRDIIKTYLKHLHFIDFIDSFEDMRVISYKSIDLAFIPSSLKITIDPEISSPNLRIIQLS
jgi:hypothetical protein